MAQMRKYEDDQPRADDGKWTGGGGGGSTGGSSDGGSGSTSTSTGAQISERGAASLKDRTFATQHGARLSEAADRASAGLRNGTDEHHSARVDAMHDEAARIHSETEQATATAGPHADRLNQAANDARIGRTAGETHDNAMAALHQERAAIAVEQSALAAGHVSEVPHAALDEHAAFQTEAREELGKATEQIDHANQQAINAVGALNAHIESSPELSDEHDAVDFDHGALEDAHAALVGGGDRSYEPQIADAADGAPDRLEPQDAPEESEYYDELGHQEALDAHAESAPARSSFASDRDFETAAAAHAANAPTEDAHGMAEYKAAVAEHAAHQQAYEAQQAADLKELHARATAAQDALEALHEKQVAALGRLKEIEAKDTALGKASDKEGEIDPEDLVSQSLEEGEARDRAAAAADSMLTYSRSVRGRELGVDATDELRAAAKETASTVRGLAKLTGRPAKLAGKTRSRKSANRPDDDAGRIVARMAPSRYRLKLNKLDFVSPVDVPAQETARVLLIKRSGRAAGFASVAKVDESLGLVFCWAFTSTIKGADYHDLQGDAIDEDFIKAAADFMSSGGAVDEMHDGEATGRVVFAFPMTPEIAKTYGVTTDTTGLMVALKPSPSVLAKFKSGEYTGVSIAGLGTREPVGKGYPRRGKPDRKRMRKSSVLTSVTDGHQHTICLDDPADCWTSHLTTSCQTSEGATEEHSHAWVYDQATGAITIALDSGHAHTVDAVVPADVIADANADDDDGSPTSEPEPPHHGPTVVTVSLRSGSNSPPQGDVPTVKIETKESAAMATEQETKIAELEKRNARLEKMSTMTDAQRAHLGKLSGADADAYIGKSSHERDVVLADIEKANEIVYTSTVDGAVYRKNDDRRLIEMAKRADASDAARKQSDIEKREAEFSKRGNETLTAFPEGVKKDLRGRIMKALNTEFSDPKEYEEAVTAMKGMNHALKSQGSALGVTPVGDPSSQTPSAQLAALTKRAMEDKKLGEAAAMDAVLNTPEGQALYAQIPVGRA